MKLAAIIAIAIVSVSSEDFTPIYSPSYANVYYQRSEGGTTRNGEKFNSPRKEQEELIPPQVPDKAEGTTCVYDDVNPTETVTEPDSEQVHFNRRKNQVRNKSREAIELSEELDPTDEDRYKPNSLPDVNEQGIYYVYHPNGLLQKVVFATSNDAQNMEYFAQFNYQNVQPILEPIYTYDPNTFAFQRLELYSN